MSGALLSSLRASLERLGLERVDLYQIHGPISLRGHAAIAEALAGAHQQGLVRAVGVSNYSVRETRKHRRPAAQARPAPGHRTRSSSRCCARSPETERPARHLRRARRRAPRLLADRPGPPHRQVLGRRTRRPATGTSPPTPWSKVDEVVAELRRIGDANGGKTPSQVALNWIIAKGAVPIPGAKNRDQADQNAGALGWTMSDDDVAALDAVALAGTSSPRATASGSTADPSGSGPTLGRLKPTDGRLLLRSGFHDRPSGTHLSPV